MANGRFSSGPARPNHHLISLRDVEIDRSSKVNLSKTKGRLRPAWSRNLVAGRASNPEKEADH